MILKTGQFSFSEQNLVIAVNPGWPGLTVAWTYNSLNPDAGDLGVTDLIPIVLCPELAR